jgi:hypothetical protein
MRGKMTGDIILLGGNQLNNGIIQRKKILKYDRLIVFDWNKSPFVKGDVNIQIDIKDTNKILNCLEKLNIENILLSYTSTDLGVETQIAIHKKFGLLAPSRNIVKNIMNKKYTTDIWRQNHLLKRASIILEEKKDLDKLPIPKNDIIIKPNISSGSRGITILTKKHTYRELLQAFRKAQEESIDKKVLIEEFVTGQEYTVEMLGDNYGNVCVWGISKKYHTNHTNSNKIAVKLHYNSIDVPDELVKKITCAAIHCYKSLNLKNSFGHLEMIVDANEEIEPLEMGARSSGYIATHLQDAINYSSYLKEYALVIRGKRIRNGYRGKRNISSMYFFYDLPPGISKKKTNLLDYCNCYVRSLSYNRDMLNSGVKFENIHADHERYGFEILKGPKELLTSENIIEWESEFIKNFMGIG